MPQRDEVSWNTIMSGYVKLELYPEAVEVFRQMWVQGFHPDGFMVTTLVTACDRSGSMFAQGVQIQCLVCKTGLLRNVFVGTAFLHFYGSYCFMSEATSVFAEMPEKNTVSWTCLMVGYSSNGDPQMIVEIYRRMRREGVGCNQSSFSTVISSCGLLGGECLGHQILAHVVHSGFEFNVSVANSLVSMFGSFGNVEDAKYVFEGMEERDMVSWNSIVSAYSRSGLCEESLRCFSLMRQSKIRFNSTTLSSLVYGCSSINDLNWGRGIHGLAFKLGFHQSACLCTTLVTLYSELGRFKDAELLFREMPEKDLVSWNSMLYSYVQNEQFQDALKLLAELHRAIGIINEVTFAHAFAACSFPESLNDGKVLHALCIRAGLSDDLLVGNALVTMYGNCGKVAKAEQVLTAMPVRDTVTWNALIGAYSENEEPQQALKIFKLMREDSVTVDYITILNLLGCSSVMDDLLDYGMPIHAFTFIIGFEQNCYVQNSILTMYAKCGDLGSSKIIFEQLDVKNVVSWNAMVAANAHHGCSEGALKLFAGMHRSRLELDCFSFLASLAASASLALLEEGRQIHNLIIKTGLESDNHVTNALLDMYGKCGILDDVHQMLPAAENRSQMSWNILISTYSRHGYCKEAKETFQLMMHYGRKPDYITFIFLLSAFNHGGLVEEGLKYFTHMSSEFQVLPGIEHCACVVDLLGRSGRLVEAEKFIEDMPIPPNDHIWRSLLSACLTYNNMELGEKAAKHLIEWDSSDDSAYILLSNMYAFNGRWKDVENLRKKMEMSNIQKTPGCSWLRVN